MKNPKFTYAIYALSLALAFAAPIGSLRAELTSEEVQEDSITPEGGSSALEEEVVIVKKKPARVAAKKRIVVREESLPEENSYEPVMVQTQSQSQSQAQVQTQAAAKPSMGSSLDQGVQTKMDDVKAKFEEAILRSLDRIKVTVDDGSQAQAQSQSQAQTQSGVTIVQDSVVNAQGAPSEAYLSVENAPDMEEEGGESVADADLEKKSTNSVRIAPVLGWTSINSDFYEIDSRYTAGINIEVDVSDNLAAVLGYSYSQYDIGLGGSNPALGFNPSFFNNNQQKLAYNQNVFDATLRLYLFPRDAKFRMFVGGGAGYNKGYLNYKTSVFNTYSFNQYNNLEDYEVTSYLGILETGAEISVAKNVAIGANFKYATVLSSSENRPLNNYGFASNGFGTSISQDQRIVGGTLADNSFYSILGTVKVSF